MTNEQYYELIKPYEDASRVLSTRLEILNHSLYGDRSDAGPIHNIQGRIKEKKSMESKLVRLGFTAGVTNARNHLQDIAGLRIICYFVEDIYNLTAALKKQSDLVIIKEKDYIRNAKPNGYRSYHIVLGIPVYFLDTMEYFPVEVQLRTMAMDFWASLDHQLKYKKSFIDDNGEISEELKQCAEVIAGTDVKMLEIRKKIEAQGVTVRRD